MSEFEVVCRDGTIIPFEQVIRENAEYRPKELAFIESSKRSALYFDSKPKHFLDWHIDLESDKP
jgi:hypothetical protein